jgi:hypothetical protein
MPLRGQRAYKLTIPTVPTGGPFGTNKLIFNDEFVTSEIGQVARNSTAWAISAFW